MRLVELLDEAKQRCAEGIRERRGDEMSGAEIEDAAAVMGYGAVKYADLKNNRNTNYKCAPRCGRCEVPKCTAQPTKIHCPAARRFSFDEMLDLKGNTAVYMLYAHARVAGIARKAGRDTAQLAASSSIQLEHPSEVGPFLMVKGLLS